MVRDSVFISYSHNDEEYHELFKQMLVGQRLIRTWSDEDLREGGDWAPDIHEAIRGSRVALLLLSPAFCNSSFITETELPALLDQREEGLEVCWVVIRAVEVPEPLRGIQGFKVHDDVEMALEQLQEGDRRAEVKKIVRRIVDSLPRQHSVKRDEVLSELKDAVVRFDYRDLEEVAVGENSVVYRASAGQRRVAVKVLVESKLGDRAVASEEELQAVEKLTHEAFLRLVNWSIEEKPRFLVTDYLGVPTLERELRRGPLRVDQSTRILQVMARALREYHELGLVYGNMHPSDVLIERHGGDEVFPRLPAARFSWFVQRREERERNFHMNARRLTYLTPEGYDAAELTHRSDQYSLALLGVEMLLGHAPVRVSRLKDLDAKAEFFRDPTAAGTAWIERAPHLAPLLLRMLKGDPMERWPSMEDVCRELGEGRSLADNNRRAAKQSYARISDRDEFYRRFYECLFSAAPALEAKFPVEGDGDPPFTWSRQRQALDHAVLLLVNFLRDHSAEPTILSDTAQRHAKLGLTPSDFDAFQAAFLQALADLGETSEEVREAWAHSMQPGMDYMKRHACVAPTVDDPGARGDASAGAGVEKDAPGGEARAAAVGGGTGTL